MADPIQPVIDALKYLAIPNPALIDSTPQLPAIWAGSADPATPNLLLIIGPLMTALYGTSNDMQTVGQEIGTALDKVVEVIDTLATKLAGIAPGDIDNIMTGLQQAMALAQTLMPGGATNVLDSASKLFQQIHDLVEAIGPAKSGAELAQLSQLLRLIRSTIAL